MLKGLPRLALKRMSLAAGQAGEEVSEESKRQDIQEIINYRQALRTAEKALRKRPFSLNRLLELQS